MPDVPLEAYEKKVLKEIGLTPADEENVGLRLKTIPAYENDPRGTPPEATITTKTGLLFEPSSVDLAICQRFSKEKEAKRDPRDALQARMTESQMDCTASMSFETPEHSGLVTLTPLMEYLSTEMDAERIFSLHRQNFRYIRSKNIPKVPLRKLLKSEAAKVSHNIKLCKSLPN